MNNDSSNSIDQEIIDELVEKALDMLPSFSEKERKSGQIEVKMIQIGEKYYGGVLQKANETNDWELNQIKEVKFA